MHIPSMQNVLSTQPVSFDTWLELAVVAIGLIVVMEVDKWITFRKEKLSKMEA
jgi:plastocyanin domain-containing protein